MADIKYKIDWVPEAKKKKQREQSAAQEPEGIGAKPKSEGAMDQDFYERMYGAIQKYFSNAEEADLVLTGKEIDRGKVKESVLREFDSLDKLLIPADPATPSLDYYQGQDIDATEDSIDLQANRLVESAETTFERPPKTIGALSDTTPLPKGIEEPSPVTEEELPPAETSGGLMSPRLDQKGKTPISELQKYTTDYAETYLTQHEGLKAHKSLEGGKDTAALGVKFSLGLDRKDYSSDAEFAAAVALKHRDKAKAKFKEADWEALPDSVKYAIVDLNYNTGTIGSTANKDSTVNMMKNTLDFIGMTTKAGDKASLISLAKRRAWNWNKAADDIGESKITKIKQIPTDSGGTKFEYLDKDDNVVHSLTTSRKPVKLSSDGTATTLTETREITL